MASAARAVYCQLRSSLPDIPARSSVVYVSVPKPKSGDQEGGNIVLQPRLCTLRSFGSDPLKTKSFIGNDDEDVSPFIANLYEYIESSKKSHDFEIIFGRLAMMVFAATVTMEVVTGNSLFRKMDLQGIAEAAGVCLGAVSLAAFFAFSSNARNRVGTIFTVGCNTFIDSLIDQIVDGLFYDHETDPRD